jgi:hypothetical protein
MLGRIEQARLRKDEAEERKLLAELEGCYKYINRRGGKVRVDPTDNTVSITGQFRSVHKAETRRPDSAIAMAIKDFVTKCELPRVQHGFAMPKFAEHVKKHIKARRYTPPDPKPHWEF